MKLVNTKSEVRNPKWFDMLTILSKVEGQIQMTKNRNPKQYDLEDRTRIFDLFRISDFDIRILPEQGFSFRH